jgi:hypothetical protein
MILTKYSDQGYKFEKLEEEAREKISFLNFEKMDPGYTPEGIVYERSYFNYIEPFNLSYYSEKADSITDFTLYPDRDHNYTIFLPYRLVQPYLEGYVR